MRYVTAVMAAAVLCVALNGCSTARFALYGKDAALTTADSATVDRAVMRVHYQFANYVTNADGSRSCPSYQAMSKTWAIGTPSQPRKKQLSRSALSFDDADGKQVKIETVAVKGEPTIIFVTYDKPDGPTDVLRELRTALKAEGVKFN